MKVSDFIVEHLTSKGIEAAFGYPGGMVTHLMDSFSKTQGIKAYCSYHEQGAAFAACGYAQSANKVGVAFATSGPGATNLITGVCHAYFESVPVLFITGQVNTYEAKGTLQIRQKGFQETDVVAMVTGVTKYCMYIDKAEDIKYEIDKALHYATSGRPGPVLLDIPMDIQRADIDENNLREYQIEARELIDYNAIKLVLSNAIKAAKQPVLLVGNGIKSSGMRECFKQFAEKINIPVVSSMIAVDLLPRDTNYYYGFVGAYGNRCANFVISQADLIISLGSRIDCRQTGANVEEFGKNAKLIRIDVDYNEFTNKIKCDEIDISADLKDLLPLLAQNDDFVYNNFYDGWKRKCNYYRDKLDSLDSLVPNEIVQAISDLIPDHFTITTDVGQNQVWVAQSFQVKRNQRLLFSGGHGAMGFSLPAAIGAYYATKQPVVCITGDGGLQMNMQELQFIVRENIPVKVLLLNNNSLGMIRHFQEMYFDSNYALTVRDHGFSNPDFIQVVSAYGIRSYCIDDSRDLHQYVAVLSDDQPAFFEIAVGDITYTSPKLVYNKPIYDQDPPLDRNLLDEILNFE